MTKTPLQPRQRRAILREFSQACEDKHWLLALRIFEANPDLFIPSDIIWIKKQLRRQIHPNYLASIDPGYPV